MKKLRNPYQNKEKKKAFGYKWRINWKGEVIISKKPKYDRFR